jgi:hypothetical protein
MLISGYYDPDCSHMNFLEGLCKCCCYTYSRPWTHECCKYANDGAGLTFRYAEPVYFPKEITDERRK